MMNRHSKLLLTVLDKLQFGQLTMTLPDASTRVFGSKEAGALSADIAVHDWALFSAVFKSGDIGFAESYIAGHWSSSDIARLLTLCIKNRQRFEELIYGSWWGNVLYRIKHLFNRNSQQGSKKNIQAHYDLGNEFYRLWLDESWNYSSALFNGNLKGDLAAAQQAKMSRALNQAGVKQGSRVLEIGCGWGAVAELANSMGAQLTGITLSKEQLIFGQARLAASEHPKLSTLAFLDYRNVVSTYGEHSFDAVVSIEMFEAVGQAYWPSYFSTIQKALKQGGKACVQTIYIDDALFERYQSGTDFIQQYIFPGGMLPSPSAFERAANQAGLKVVERFDFGADYAETLRRWRSAYMAALPQVRALGFDERFIRIWEFYLVYCEAAFDTGNTGVAQYTLEKI